MSSLIWTGSEFEAESLSWLSKFITTFLIPVNSDCGFNFSQASSVTLVWSEATKLNYYLEKTCTKCRKFMSFCVSGTENKYLWFSDWDERPQCQKTDLKFERQSRDLDLDLSTEYKNVMYIL